MFDIKDAIIIIPRAITEAIKLYIIQCIDGIIKLDSSPMDAVKNVQSIPITLNMFLDISLNQDIVVVDLPPLFGLYLSRESTTKLWGYLSLDYIHILLPHKDKYIKIPNEGTKVVHLKKISKQNCMNAPGLVETYD